MRACRVVQLGLAAVALMLIPHWAHAQSVNIDLGAGGQAKSSPFVQCED